MNRPATPGRADWTIDQNWSHYTAAEHATWKTLYERQAKLLPGRACDEFLAGMKALSIGPEHIPDFAGLNQILMQHTGWQVVAVPGLIPNDVFFTHLAARRFPAGNFIRTSQQLDYLQEPDVFHDVFGHAPMLMNPAFADYLQAYGAGGLRAERLGVLDQLSRVYWYTVEFGLVEQRDGLRLYGAGIASSYAESRFCLESPSPNRIRFDLARVMRTQYRIDDFQETYFVVRSFDALLELARIDFSAAYEAARQQAVLAPGDLIDSDQILTRGTAAYHDNHRERAGILR